VGQDLVTEIFVDSLEKFRVLVLNAFRQKLRIAEKEAKEAGWAVLGEFRVGAEHLAEPLLRICFVCEPGKVARVVRVDGPEDCSALFFEKDRSRARLH
jgi:hypothetical protein